MPHCSHMKHSKDYTCSAVHYKCPEFYCIPLRYVCDGRYHCPGGLEETQCNRTSCPALFNCHSSVICIHLTSICDSVTDCPMGDDEFFCDSNLPICPINCECFLFSIACSSTMTLLWKTGMITPFSDSWLSWPKK